MGFLDAFLTRWLILLPGLVAAIVFHELGHALVAYRLGDPTPKYTGRLTLNPLAHFELLGFLMILIAPFGWARPVQVNPYHFRDPRRGMILVAAAGPLANLLLAYLAVSILTWLPALRGGVSGAILQHSIFINISLAVFNLIPIPPLDGSKILANLLPSRPAMALQGMDQYGFLILFVLLWMGVIGQVVSPVSGFLLGGMELLARLGRPAPLF